MRFITVASGLVVAFAAGSAHAQAISASGAVGAGLVADSPATMFEVGVDVAGEDYAFGVGGRVTLLASEGLRTEDWDENSEIASLVRYAVYRSPAESQISVAAAAGELGFATLGRGFLVDGLSMGLDIDHSHLGVHGRSGYRGVGIEVLVDDVVRPSVIAARGEVLARGRYGLAVDVAGDIAAPTMGGIDHVLLGSAEASIHGDVSSTHIVGLATTSVIAGLGSGLHLGLELERTVLGELVLGAAVSGYGGTDRYLPGYVGALYQRSRYIMGAETVMISQLDAVRAGGLSGLGGRVALSARVDDLARLEMVYTHRAGLGGLAYGRLSSAQFRNVQLAAGGAIDSAEGTLAAAAEIRVRLPLGVFIAGEAARLFRTRDDNLVSVWQLGALCGVVIGE